MRFAFLLLGVTLLEDALNSIMRRFLVSPGVTLVLPSSEFSWAKIPRLGPYRNPKKRLSCRIRFKKGRLNSRQAGQVGHFYTHRGVDSLKTTQRPLCSGHEEQHPSVFSKHGHGNKSTRILHDRIEFSQVLYRFTIYFDNYIATPKTG